MAAVVYFSEVKIPNKPPIALCHIAMIFTHQVQNRHIMIIDESINIITIDGKTASKTLLAMGLKLATLLSASL